MQILKKYFRTVKSLSNDGQMQVELQLSQSRYIKSVTDRQVASISIPAFTVGDTGCSKNSGRFIPWLQIYQNPVFYVTTLENPTDLYE